MNAGDPVQIAREPAVVIDGQSLDLHDLLRVARKGAGIELEAGAREPIQQGNAAVHRLIEAGEPVYGLNTGFGALSTRSISRDDASQLQVNLLRSHAAGSGHKLPDDVTRAALLLRANSLCQGLSGVRVEVVERLVALLNAGIVPVIPEQGSLGASGDLAPLAHMALPLVGLGEVVLGGETLPASEALQRAGIEPLQLGPKEALALINGTATMAATSGLALLDSERALSSAVGVAALSMLGLGALRDPLDERVHRARPHPGQLEIAARLRELLGPLKPGERTAKRIQDPYSVRCVPQVYGAIRDGLRPLRHALEIELNAATDNPLVFPDDDSVISGGNFHGHPLALPMEGAKVAVASLGTIIERRVALLVDGEEYGLPAFLVANPGLNSGYMIAHYLTAGLVAENRVIAHPSSVDSIPTSANIEDYNSMGMTAARHLRQIVDNVEKVIAVEALCAAQACDLRGIIPSGALGGIYEAIRQRVPTLEQDDHVIADDIESIRRLVREGGLIPAEN